MKPSYFHQSLFAGLMILSTAKPAAALDTFFNPDECTSKENKVITCAVDAAKEMGATVELVGVKDLSPPRQPFTKPDKTQHRYVYILMRDGDVFADALMKPANRYIEVAVGNYSRDKGEFVAPHTRLKARIHPKNTKIIDSSSGVQDGGYPDTDKSAVKTREEIARRIARGLAQCTK